LLFVTQGLYTSQRWDLPNFYQNDAPCLARDAPPLTFLNPGTFGVRHNRSRSGAPRACNLCEIPLPIFIPRGAAGAAWSTSNENAGSTLDFHPSWGRRAARWHGALLRKYPDGASLPSRRHAYRIVVMNLGGSGLQPQTRGGRGWSSAACGSELGVLDGIGREKEMGLNK